MPEDNFFIGTGISRDSVVIGAIQKLENDTIELIRESLESFGAFASGELAQSIDVRHSVEGSTLRVSIYMDEYWKFVDKGVKGTQDQNAPNSPYSFKPSKKMIPAHLLSGSNGWIASKGISLSQIATKRKNKDGVFVKRKKALTNIQANKTLSFAMAKMIHKKGVKPKPFFTSVINDDWIKEFTVEMAKALGEDLRDSIIELIEK